MWHLAIIYYTYTMILKGYDRVVSAGELGFGEVRNDAPMYVEPKLDEFGKIDTNHPNYDKNKLPPGFTDVKITIPKGYEAATNISPEIVSKALSVLGSRQKLKIPFNQGVGFYIEENGKVTEYLALVTLHFDNHPRPTLNLPDGSNVKHPPFWHPGVSIFRKIGSGVDYDTFMKKNQSEDIGMLPKGTKEDPNIFPKEEEIRLESNPTASSPTATDIVFSDDFIIQASKKALKEKIIKLVADFKKY